MDAQIIIARRVARELRPGNLVNLGIGIPTLVANYLPADLRVFFQSENGLIGTGPIPEQGMAHPLLTDAAGRPISALPGASTFDSPMPFGFTDHKAILLERAPGISIGEVMALTEADLSIPNDVPEMKL